MTFEAKYHGRCGVCDEKVRPGDQCAYAEDVIVHADCPEPVAEKVRRICGGCFMETAANGTCPGGCDE